MSIKGFFSSLFGRSTHADTSHLSQAGLPDNNLMKELLDECRKNFANGSRTVPDNVPAIAKPHYEQLYEQGQVFWGFVVQANDGAYVKGDSDLPANTVYSPDEFFVTKFSALAALSNSVASLKNKVPATEGVARIAKILTDEQQITKRDPLPPELSDGRIAYLGTTFIERGCVPERRLANSFLPLVICPSQTPWNMILPLDCWPMALVKLWLETGERDASDSNAVRRLRENASDNVVVRFTDEEIMQRYTASPIQLTPIAAKAIRQVIAQQRITSTACVVVGLRRNKKAWAYSLDVMERPSKTGCLTESEGVSIATESDRLTLTLLTGLVIDYSEKGQGFVFNNPNAEKH